MRWLIRFERYFDWLAVSGLFKYLTFLWIVVFISQMINPEIYLYLNFDAAKVFRGEIWRVFTYIFADASALESGFNNLAIKVLFLYFAVRLCFLMSDSLEAAWGPTRLTLYILAFWLSNLALMMIGLGLPFGAGAALYLSVFFAFATLFPTVEFLLMFILPVQVRWLAWISLIILVLNFFRVPLMALMFIPVFVPYALWVLPDVIHGRKTLIRAAMRRQKFNASQMSEHEAFHRCAVCGRTERDAGGDLEFRVTADGKEYCTEHLPPS